MVGQKKVVIAMSGGVDSSVAASLLVDQGYEVTGIMLKLWSDQCGDKPNACCPPEAIQQARDVASILNIPFYVVDTQDVFKKQIVDPFIEKYALGLTPNPCFNCNRLIRWGYLLNFCLSTGNDYMATGHYARLVHLRDGQIALKKGIDESKDQSYVLSGLTKEQLSRTLLPLGDYRKIEIREIARRKGLPVAEKHDSQDLCFVGKNGYRNFLMRYAAEALNPGEIKDLDGRIVGQHEGLANYTIGQRKGLGAGFSRPMYVIQKETATNTLVIGPEDKLGGRDFIVRDLQWMLDQPGNKINCTVKIRYKSAYLPCTITCEESNKAKVKLDKPARDLTPGQIAVFYKDDIVIGSGEIQLL